MDPSPTPSENSTQKYGLAVVIGATKYLTLHHKKVEVENVAEGVKYEKKSKFESSIKERRYLNYVIVLFLILIGRFGSNLITGDIFYTRWTIVDTDQLVNNTSNPISWNNTLLNSNSTNYYVGLSSLSGSVFGEALNVLIGLSSVIIFIPYMEKFLNGTRMNKDGLLISWFVTFIKILKIPYIPFLISAIGMFLAHVGLTVSLFSNNFNGLIIFRILFSICDAFHRCLSTLD